MYKFLRPVFLVAALAACVVASAQRYYLADQQGREITGNLMIGSRIGSKKTFQIWIENGLQEVYSGGGIFVGFDRGYLDGKTRYPSNRDAQSAGRAKKIALGDRFNNYARGLLGEKIFPWQVVAVNVQDFAPPISSYWYMGASSSANNAFMERSIGTFWTWCVGLGYRFYFTRKARLHLADIDIFNRGMAPGEVFGGKSNQNGLTINDLGSTPTGNSWLWANGKVLHSPAHKYLVQAAP